MAASCIPAGCNEYDRLTAILHKCARYCPATQNWEVRPDFRAYLRGRIAYVAQLHPARGAKLLARFERIPWDR